MFIKLLGILDLLAALVLLLSPILPSTIVMTLAVYLLVKGGIFLLAGDKVSLADVAVAAYMMLAAMDWTNAVITTVASLFLIQKGIFSILN